jgi:hypothetical protein
MIFRKITTVFVFLSMFAALQAGTSLRIAFSTGDLVKENLYGYPMLVRLSTTNFPNLAQAVSTDIRFTKKDGATVLPHLIEQWTATEAAIWVRLDTVYAGSNEQSFFMHYGSANGLSLLPAQSVFDTANGFVLVAPYDQEIGPDDTTANDATWNAGHGTITRTDPTVDSMHSIKGSIAGGIRTVGDCRITFPPKKTGYSSYTYSCWIRPRQTNSFQGNLLLSSDMVARLHIGKNGSDSRIKLHLMHDLMSDGHYSTHFSEESVRVNRWHYVVMVCDDLAKVVTIHVNGTEVHRTDFKTHSSFNPQGGFSPINGGFFVGGGFEIKYFGYIDQSEVSSVARSASWVNLNHASQLPGSTLLTIADQDVPVIPMRKATPHTPAITFKHLGNEFIITYSGGNRTDVFMACPSGRIIARTQAGAGVSGTLNVEQAPAGMYLLAAGAETVPVTLIR